MTDTPPAFTPEPPDPRLEELDEKIATLMAEALVHFILRKGLLKSGQPTTASSMLGKAKEASSWRRGDDAKL